MNRAMLPLALAVLALLVTPLCALAQFDTNDHVPGAAAQRSAMNGVRTQMRSLHNATQTARNFGDTGVDIVWQQFQGLRNSFNGYLATLQESTRQRYANEWAELTAGLDIIQQAFDVYRQDLTDGRTTATALSNLTRVMDQASRIWLQRFNQAALNAQTRP
jgi:hypothetical protein